MSNAPIQHFSAAEYIQMQSDRIEQLTTEIQELHHRNATLTAINLKLRSTDLSAADIAESLRSGCPEWRAVAAELLPCQCQQSAEQPHLVRMEPHLTTIERRLFRHLLLHAGKTISAATLVEASGMKSVEGLWVHILRLRKKLSIRLPQLRLETVRGVGYRLEEGE